MTQRKFAKLFIVFACAIVGIFALGNVHSALAALDTGIAFGAGTGLSATDPRIIIANIIRVLLGFLGTIAVVLIMYAGFVMMTSEGDPAKTQKAKDVLKSAIIGLIIILSAFGIASFVINSLMEATTGIKQAPQESGAPTGFNGGMSALGGGIIQSVYPYPFQKDVPRNTSIMITFKEPMASSTLMDTAGNMLVANVSIFMKGDTCTEKGCTIPRKGLLVTAKARTVDNKTFVFTPNALIGLVSNNSDYMVSLGDGIAKANGEKAFTNMNASGRSWEFQANTTTDLDPPRVSSIFPRPDNSKDINLGAGLAAQATGQIIASSTPNIDVVASANPLASNAVKVNVIGNYNCSKDQIISVSLDDAMIATVNASSGGGAFGLVNGDNAADGKIEIGCGLTVSKADSLPFTAGDIWQIGLISSKSADTLTVGSITYKFVSALVSGVSNQIIISNNLNTLATYIRAALVLNSAINVTPATDKVINIESRAPGVAGNNLVISTSNNSALPITAMHNGANAVMSIDPATLPKDQPKNAIIQLTFNEAINPINLIGTSNQVQDTIRVIDSTHANVIVTGNFNISNLYKTIAFTPNNPCGVNACGQSIYCLPADANLKIELVAASLDTCARNEDCVSKNPYAICSTSKHCQKPAPDSTNYPMASTTSNTGIIDAAMNSLDGNRDSKAQGPISYFNENIKPADRTLADAAKGDSFQWSFWTSDQLDISSPTITGQSVSQGSSILDANLANSITLEFSKVMESNSLSTGITELTIGGKKITHKKINLNNLNNQPVGYWITSAGADETSQPDTYPEKTNAFLNHTPFLTANSFKASVGSGVRDIYQNCFKPCQGPAETCTGLSDTKPSWCSGTAQASDTCPK